MDNHKIVKLKDSDIYFPKTPLLISKCKQRCTCETHVNFTTKQ